MSFVRTWNSPDIPREPIVALHALFDSFELLLQVLDSEDSVFPTGSWARADCIYKIVDVHSSPEHICHVLGNTELRQKRRNETT